LRKLLVRFVRQSPPMIVAMIALFVALSGTAVATTSALITGNQIKNNSITGIDVKNKSLTAKDFRGSVRGARGPAGPTGPAGPAGPKGDTGPPGAPNPNAVNSDQLDGLDSTAFQTTSASDVRTVTAALSTSNQDVLSTTITVPAQKTVVAVASVEVGSNGGGDDNMNCNINIAGSDGARQSTYVTPNSLDDSTTLPLTQTLAVGAGTHTVLVECNEGIGSASTVEDRSLSVVAVG
jgi:hypothetical protein